LLQGHEAPAADLVVEPPLPPDEPPPDPLPDPLDEPPEPLLDPPDPPLDDPPLDDPPLDDPPLDDPPLDDPPLAPAEVPLDDPVEVDESDFAAGLSAVAAAGLSLVDPASPPPSFFSGLDDE